jgi:nitrogen fixation NifU-like protein
MSYSPKVLKHFKHPHNQGVIKNADAIGQEGNPVCGDVMRMYLKVGQKAVGSGNNSAKEPFIKDIKFETLGCAAAIAVSSALTDLAKGKTLTEALKIDKDKVVDDLGGLPVQKVHCSMLGVDALHTAIRKYQKLNVKS